MDAQRARVILLFGGYWDERPVSGESAANILDPLRKSGLSVKPVRWDADGWAVLAPDVSAAALMNPAAVHPAVTVIEEIRRGGDAVVFNCLHGGPGEDGTVQGFLEVAGVPYTGASVYGSAITGNKESFRRMVAPLGCEVAEGFVVDRGVWIESADRVLQSAAVDVGFPIMVKPLTSGSSYGVSKCDDPESLVETVARSLTKERQVLLERFVPGREVSIPCLGTRLGEPVEVLPLVEIESLTESGYFDLEAKYEPGKARETIPAPLEDDVADHLARLAARIHHDLDLGGFSRTDVILGADGPVFLETQTVPGLTSGSLYPASAAHAGISLPSLCRRLIDYALSVHVRRGV